MIPENRLSISELHNIVYFETEFRILLYSKLAVPSKKNTFTVSMLHRELIDILTRSNLNFEFVKQNDHSPPSSGWIWSCKTTLLSSLVTISMDTALVPALFNPLISLQRSVKVLLTKKQIHKIKQQLVARGVKNATVTDNGYMIDINPSDIGEMLHLLLLGVLPAQKHGSKRYADLWISKSNPPQSKNALKTDNSETSDVEPIPNYRYPSDLQANNTEEDSTESELPCLITKRLELTRGKVSNIIGRNGSNIERIRRETNCLIKAKVQHPTGLGYAFSSSSSTPQCMSVMGSPGDVQKAIEYLSNSLKLENSTNGVKTNLPTHSL